MKVYKLIIKVYPFFSYLEFAVVNSNYVNLLQSFPEDYPASLNAVIEHITDAQTVLILDSPTPFAANQRILNCLIERLRSKVEVIALCDNLDKIRNVRLSRAVEKLRNGKALYCQWYVWTYTCAYLCNRDGNCVCSL